MTKTVLETALEAEMTEHLGYDRHEPMGRNGEKSRNGTREESVLPEIDAVTIGVPRDRDGTFDPLIVRKRQRRLDGVAQIVLSLSARGLTTGEIDRTFPQPGARRSSLLAHPHLDLGYVLPIALAPSAGSNA